MVRSIRQQKICLLSGALLAVATLVLYYPVKNYPFFGDDDPLYITKNAHVQAGLVWSTVVWAFRHHYINWHPLTWIFHALNFQLFGLDPGGHHVVNALFHAINAAILFFVLKQATGYTGRSFMVAALFAFHPINVEPVVWVSELKTPLSTMFFLLALASYRWYAARPSQSRYFVLASLFVLGLLAKPQVIMLPFLLLLWDYWPLNRVSSTKLEPECGSRSAASSFHAKRFVWLLKEKGPLFFIAGLDALITIQAQGVTHPAYVVPPLPVRISNAIFSYFRYIQKAFLPINLGVFYPHPGRSLQEWRIAGAGIFLLAISTLIFMNRRRPYLVVGWLWFLLSLLPMIGLIQVGTQGMADRYAYGAFIGIYIIICWQIPEWVNSWHLPRIILPILSIVALVCLGYLASRQISYWKDAVSLWSHTAQVTKDNWEAEFYLGRAFYDQDDLAKAREYFLKAHYLNPSQPTINIALGSLEQRQGNFSAAIAYYQNGVHSPEINPDLKYQALSAMGNTYNEMGDSAEARKSFEAANAIRR